MADEFTGDISDRVRERKREARRGIAQPAPEVRLPVLAVGEATARLRDDAWAAVCDEVFLLLAQGQSVHRAAQRVGWPVGQLRLRIDAELAERAKSTHDDVGVVRQQLLSRTQHLTERMAQIVESSAPAVDKVMAARVMLKGIEVDAKLRGAYAQRDEGGLDADVHRLLNGVAHAAASGAAFGAALAQDRNLLRDTATVVETTATAQEEARLLDCEET